MRSWPGSPEMGVNLAKEGIAEEEFAPTHPVRLEVAFKFSAFYYEILNSPDKGRNLAQQAIDEANAMLGALPKKSYKDSVLVMPLGEETYRNRALMMQLLGVESYEDTSLIMLLLHDNLNTWEHYNAD